MSQRTRPPQDELDMVFKKLGKAHATNPMVRAGLTLWLTQEHSLVDALMVTVAALAEQNANYFSQLQEYYRRWPQVTITPEIESTIREIKGETTLADYIIPEPAAR